MPKGGLGITHPQMSTNVRCKPIEPSHFPQKSTIICCHPPVLLSVLCQCRLGRLRSGPPKWGSGSRWTFSNVKALIWPVKQMHSATGKGPDSRCLLVSTAVTNLFRTQRLATFGADTTQPVLNVVFCLTATGTPHRTALGAQRILQRSLCHSGSTAEVERSTCSKAIRQS
jgi:hypothetical protein